MRDFLTARDVFKRSAFDLWAATTSDRMLPRTREKPQISEVLSLKTFVDSHFHDVLAFLFLSHIKMGVYVYICHVSVKAGSMT